jgi:hypothetical protein
MRALALALGIALAAGPALADPAPAPAVLPAVPAVSAPVVSPAPAPAPAVPAPGAPAPASPPSPRHGSNAGWLLAGTSVAFLITGTVLAFSASSSENDIRDLYTNIAGSPATYTLAVASQYQAAIADGRRYEHLSWAAFSLAGATAIASALAFTYGRHTIEMSPIATPTSAGAAALLRF